MDLFHLLMLINFIIYTSKHECKYKLMYYISLFIINIMNNENVVLIFNNIMYLCLL